MTSAVEVLARFRNTPKEQLAKMPREELIMAIRLAEELKRKQNRALQEAPGGLIHFVRYFWDILEPGRPFVDGWVLRGMCEHLEAVSRGQIKRLLMNVSPGPMRDDSMVETARGRIALKDVQVGDLALTHKGRYRPVSAVHHQGVLPILKITTHSGRVTHAAPSHPYLTPTGWVDAKDLKVGDALAVVNREEDRPGASSISEEEARLLGYLVGDGSITQAMPLFTNADREVIDDFHRCARSLGFETSEARKKSHWIVRIKGGAAPRAWLATHGLEGCSSYTKRIPPAVMNANQHTLAAFVGAYWTCDGGFDVRPSKLRGSCYRAYGTTVSFGLATDLVYALGLLGIEARKRNWSRKLETAAQPGGIYHYYGIEVQNEAMTARFADLPGLCSRKRALAEQCRRLFPRTLWDDPIVSIEAEDDANCMCLTVEEDHSFVCSGIAVKNSMKSLLVNTFWPAWEWGPFNKPNLRYVSFSYAAHLTMRDNGRMRDLIESPKFQAMYGDRFQLSAKGVEKLATNKTGWKFASSVGGVGTGERGDRVLLDDPHNVAEGESDKVRNSTVTWFEDTMSNRLTDDDGAIVVIMQRVHDGDVSGAILDPEKGMKYVHFCVPYEYDPSRHCRTSIGWSDPRTKAGEDAWPERFSEDFLAPFRRNKYMWAGQYLQSPQVRGGNILKYEWWQKFDMKNGRGLPPARFDFVLASLDTAMTEKSRNDPSAMTVWGCFVDEKDRITKVLLLGGWEKHLGLNGGEAAKQLSGEPDAKWINRTKDKWGLAEWVMHTCKMFKVHRLLIESTAAGHPLAQELTRLLKRGEFAIQLQPPKGDKEARVHSVTYLFTDELVYAPGDYIQTPEGTVEWEFRKFATACIEQCARFPKGRDDIVDTMSQALTHLRRNNIIARKVEIRQAEEDERRYERPLQPLYPG